ncbi:Gfo/Idh/MocA family protein [Paenibacillus nasutitermitis]|uniref:Glucose-fructose oxidoreductase n=1 Tax=Paenibacillus nasutitermitis TaxID=1652958 RepID=A0A917DMY9_9BACL|nr:Gfo/Idh/MocA family oxidoreductase [Paenibacillus nasutitermitis]GGD49501.1 glucose-fructose oxidoreductase [Paenibacillus nasutitermitis]
MTITATLIGAGGIGDSHLEAISRLEGIQASALADINLERAQNCADRFGLKAYTDYRAMIAEVKPDIAIIALPHFLHREVALYCLNQGCHLLLEKPMALSDEECSEIIELANSKGLIIFVGHTQQYLAQNLTAKALIREGRLGNLIMVNDNRHCSYFTPDRPAWFLDPAKSGGGIVANLGAHCIDKIQWLTDSRIVQAKAILSYEAEGYPDVEGSASMLLTTSQGVPCTVNLSGYKGVGSEETELVFTHGMIKILNHKSVWLSRDGVYQEVPSIESVNPMRLQFLDLLACIRDGRQPYCSGDYGRSVVRVIEAVYESDKRKQEVAVKS